MTLRYDYSKEHNRFGKTARIRDRTGVTKDCILAEIGKGIVDKQVIYSNVVETLGIPRPTVRRTAKELRDDLLEVIKILQSDIPKPTLGEGY